MNIIPSPRVLLPLLLCAATSPVLAQNSGVIHFQGRIVAPVCNDAVSPEARAALAEGNVAAANAFAADTTRCGGMSASMVATTGVFSSRRSDVEPGAVTTGAARDQAGGYTPDTVWTVTYQ